MEEEAFKILENAKNYDRKSSTKEEVFCMCFLGAQPLKILVKLAFYPVVTGPKYGFKTSEKSERTGSLLFPLSQLFLMAAPVACGSFQGQGLNGLGIESEL